MEEEEAMLMARRTPARINRRATVGPVQEEKDRKSLLGFASGLFAGVVGVITGFPFDTLKVHAQVYGTTSGALKGPLNIRRLFRGIGAPLATTGVVQTLNFGIYDNVLRSLAHNNEVKLTDYFWAGSIGGACISFITTPVSLIKIQLQVNSGELGLKTVVQRMMARGLIGGFYPAFIPDLLNQSFGRGVYMVTYEALKRVQRTEEEEAALIRKPQPLYQRIVAGGVAGIMGWLSIYPLDVVKSRMQADALHPPSEKRYSGMLDCLKKSYKDGRLYTGLGFTLVRAVPVASVILPTYDAAYYMLANMLKEES